MIYHGVIVDMLTRTTQAIKVDHDEQKPDKEHVSNFCFCKWFKQVNDGECGVLIPELLALTYEVEIIKMFQKLDKESPSKFVEYAKSMLVEK